MNLEGSSSIVTGGASGIGECSAKRLAQEGACVAIADVDEQGGKRVVAEIVAAGGAASFIRTDLSKTAQVRRMVERTESRYGRLDI
ncbi:MAG: SDR family NAD(P)-dependent oxidoreductase, partial [Acidimicrobiaceae bacterium]|nr:SDR family NAD(P)-dependent oxidoreductase [Acidimicrobiaceae bacterium]